MVELPAMSPHGPDAVIRAFLSDVRSIGEAALHGHRLHGGSRRARLDDRMLR
jgi:hypothetical protein